MNNKNAFLPARLALSGAIAAVLVGGYGTRKAYAGSCPGAAGTYNCSGAANAGTDTTQSLNYNNGNITVTTTAGFGIDTSTNGGDALNIDNGGGYGGGGGGDDISFTDNNAAQITGAYRGIHIDNERDGATLVTTTAGSVVSGLSHDGMEVRNSLNATETIINAAGDVNGGPYGNGIHVTSYGTDLTVNAANVSGGYHGIYAKSRGTGSLSVTTSGVVEGANSGGIRTEVAYGGQNLEIETLGSVTGDNYGVLGGGGGDGFVRVTTHATVTAMNGDSLRAANLRGTDLVVVALADLNGGGRGIRARNYGSGYAKVTAEGVVTGTTREGLYARSEGTYLEIETAQNVTGAENGIDAENTGSGALTITSSATVEGGTTGVQDDSGIYALNEGTSLTIVSENTIGRWAGIYAQNDGSGALSVTSTGVVQGLGVPGYGRGDGVYAKNEGTNLVLNVNDVNAARHGVFAINNGTGTTLVLPVGDVAGDDDGVRIESTSPDAVTLTSNFEITGGTGAAVRTGTIAGVMSVVTFNGSAVVNTSSGTAIVNNIGDSTVTVNAGASISGDIQLGDGSDDLVISNADISTITLFDGGDDTSSTDGWVDTLSLQTSDATMPGIAVTGWENLVIDGGTITFSDAVLAVGSDAGTGVSLINDGGISMRNGMASDAFALTGNFNGSGQLFLESILGDSSTPTDTLVISGDATGVTTINIDNLGGLGGSTTGDGILLIEVQGTSAPGAFVLPGGEVSAGGTVYRLAQVGQNWYLQSNSGAAESSPLAIPTMSKLSLMFLALLSGLAGLVSLPRRRLG